MEEVDAFLGAIRDTCLRVREPSLTTDEIRDKQFSTTRLRLGYDEDEVDVFLDEVEARLRARCAECGALAGEVAQLCARCDAAVSGQRLAAAKPAASGPGDDMRTVLAAARNAGSGSARARRWYFLMFLACCVILPISGFVGIRAGSNSVLAGWMGGTIAASFFGAVIFLVAFVKALSQRRRRRVRQVAWALMPIVSFTLLAWWPFLVLALIRLRARDWAVFAAYLAALVAEIVLLILGAHAILPAAGGAIIFLAVVLLVAVTAAVHTLVAFRPAARVPSLTDANLARAAAKRQQPVIDTAGGGAATIPAWGFARPAMIFVTVASCGIAIALPARFHWAHLPVRAAEAYLVLVAAALIWGCACSWRMTLQMNDQGVTVRNFFRTRRIDWHEISGFGSDPDMEGLSTLHVLLHDGRTVTATATLKAPPGTLAALKQEAERHGITGDPTSPRSVRRRERPRPKWFKWYILWWLAMVSALLVMGGGNGAV